MGERKAGGCACTLVNQAAQALSSRRNKALVLCLKATVYFQLKVEKSLFNINVSFMFLWTSPDNDSILNQWRKDRLVSKWC